MTLFSSSSQRKRTCCERRFFRPPPSAFVMPRGWQGSRDRPERQASLEYINVRPTYLREYRDVMRKYIGPAAAKLVGMDRIGTFRAMETAAVLYRDPSLNTDWNQIHLCEVHVG